MLPTGGVNCHMLNKLHPSVSVRNATAALSCIVDSPPSVCKLLSSTPGTKHRGARDAHEQWNTYLLLFLFLSLSPSHSLPLTHTHTHTHTHAHTHTNNEIKKKKFCHSAICCVKYKTTDQIRNHPEILFYATEKHRSSFIFPFPDRVFIRPPLNTAIKMPIGGHLWAYWWPLMHLSSWGCFTVQLH